MSICHKNNKLACLIKNKQKIVVSDIQLVPLTKHKQGVIKTLREMVHKNKKNLMA